VPHDETREPNRADSAAGVRLSDADREVLAELLARHAAAGRLSTDELEARVSSLYHARSREQAARLLADLPPLDSKRPPARRRRRYGERGVPEPTWLATDERFRDPGSGRIMRVWVEPATGKRHYVPDESS
jgi:hypothetical protein